MSNLTEEYRNKIENLEDELYNDIDTLIIKISDFFAKQCRMNVICNKKEENQLEKALYVYKYMGT